MGRPAPGNVPLRECPWGLWPAAPECKVVLTAGECRVRAGECQRMAETSSRVENILADFVRTWIRLALEVEQALLREPGSGPPPPKPPRPAVKREAEEDWGR